MDRPRVAARLRQRLLVPPAEDHRQRAARLGAVLFASSGFFGGLLLPMLPATTSRPLGYLAMTGTVAMGVSLPLLPWRNWSNKALLVLPVTAIVFILGIGGYLDGSLDYYALFLPMLFLFQGSVYPPGGSLALSPFVLVAFLVSLLGDQSAAFTPYLLLILTLGVTAGEMIAHRHQTERRTLTAMSHLLEAATNLGAAGDEAEVAALVAPITLRLVRADDCSVFLGIDRLTLAGSAGAGTSPQHDAAALATRSVALQCTVVEELAVGTDTWRAVAVPIRTPGAADPRGVIVSLWSPRRRPAGSRQAGDRLGVRMLELLGAEAGRAVTRLQVAHHLTQQAHTDPLTGLGNRAVLDAALARLTPGDAVVLCDLDFFKQVNDTYGHLGGDRVLESFAECLQRCVRAEDTAARYGGEEFAVILSGNDGTGRAKAVVERLRAVWSATDPATTFSAGIAAHSAYASGELTLARADGALYAAKDAGRNTYVVAEPAGVAR